jgi:hypothetical protein
MPAGSTAGPRTSRDHPLLQGPLTAGQIEHFRWDLGYGVDRYPSYGDHWLATGRPWVDRLAAPGGYEAAAREEEFARSKRRSAAENGYPAGLAAKE